MKIYRVVLIIMLILLPASCSNKKQVEESLKQWEQAVKERDAIIADLQAQLKTCQQQVVSATTPDQSPTLATITPSESQPVVNGSPLAGTWKRTGDEYAGAIVEMQQTGDILFAVLKDAGKLTDLGFQNGEVKWKEITATGENTWKGKDIGKVKKIAQDLLGQTSAWDMTLTLSGDTLTLKGTDHEFTQVWVRE